MALIPGILPPSHATWKTACTLFQYFPVFTSLQWVLDWYPMGKTSNKSRFNVPGKWGWAIAESTGFTTMLYIMYTLPEQQGIKSLPWGNWTMAGCFVIHYIYRAVLSPLFLNPSMSPMHPILCIGMAAFQLLNAISLGGWLAGYGPVVNTDWEGRYWSMELGLIVWAWGLLGNAFHDDDLREIRRAADRKQRKEAVEAGKPIEGVDKVYMIPKNGLFRYVLFAHYFCEWIEWAGFWAVGGWKCTPARSFLVNEVATMLPRALQGKRWYEEKFGKEKVGSRKAVIPGLI